MRFKLPPKPRQATAKQTKILEPTACRHAPCGKQRALPPAVSRHVKQQLISTGLALADILQRHPKRITALLAVALLGAGSAAFAVANLSSVSALPSAPLRLVTETVTASALAQQSELLQEHSLTLYRNEQVRSSDTPESLLKRLGISDAAAVEYLRNDPAISKALFSARAAGRNITVEADERQQLQLLRTHWPDPDSESHYQRLVVQRSLDSDSGFTTHTEAIPLVPSQRLASGTIQSSLFAATDASGVPDSVTLQFIEIYESSINFRRDLRKGDQFAMVYETLEADGEAVRTGRLLSAEMVNKGKSRQAIWFHPQNAEKGDYYDPDGESLRQTYLIMPLPFTRVTSNFGMRTHPVSGFRKGHSGVDYAAPTGTTVRAVADGHIEFAGVQRGYGKVIYIKHPNGTDSTVYAHLSQIGVSTGQKISQGDKIGEVGATGVATGPHLHFEFRVNNVPQNPVEALARQQKHDPVNEQLRTAFDDQSTAMKLLLASAREATNHPFE